LLIRIILKSDNFSFKSYGLTRLFCFLWWAYCNYLTNSISKTKCLL